MNSAARQLRDRAGLWWSWTVSCSTGELIGMSIAAGLAALMNQLFGEPQSFAQRVTILSVLTFAGVLEGIAVGYFQWRVLRGVFQELSAVAWLTPTILVAAVGWFFGMLQPMFFAATEPSLPTAEPSLLSIISTAAAFGVGAGAVFGFAQWLPLRKHADRAWMWIPVNAVGWAAAMAIIFFGATLPDASWSIWHIVPLGMITGILAGLAIGAITGIGLVRIRPANRNSRLMIDKYLSQYDVRDFHETAVVADPVHAYRVLRSMDFRRSLVIRALFALRSFPAKLSRRNRPAVKKTAGQSFLEFALSIGWRILEETPDQEVVCGAVTKPWEADVTFQGMSGPELTAFAAPGFTKIVWTMAVIPETQERCRVVLETRVAATDEVARRRFRKYWFVFGPFIGLIRRIVLRMLKRELRKLPG